MVKKINFKKAMALVALFAVAFTSVPAINSVDAAMTALTVSALSSTTVKEGGSISFTLYYTGDIRTISLRDRDIGLDGFTATKTITANGNNRIVTLSNIQSTSDVLTGKRVCIAGGTAIDSEFNMVNSANGVNTSTFTILPKDKVAPVLTISAPNPTKVYAGQSVIFTLNYSDNVGIRKISLKESDIGLVGFTADKKIAINGNVVTLTLSNVQGEVGGNKKVNIAGGTAIDDEFNMANAVTSATFSIEKKVSKAPVLTISDPNPSKVYAGQTVVFTLKYTDDVKVKTISLKDRDIALQGFTADKKIVKNADNTVTLTLSNIKGSVGGDKKVYIAGGTAIDDDFNMANEVTSKAFTIVEKKSEQKPDPVKPEPKPDPVKPEPKPNDWRPNPNTGI